MGKKNRNKKKRDQTPYNSINSGQASEPEESTDSIPIVNPYATNPTLQTDMSKKASEGIGSKRNASAVASDTDISTSVVHESARARMDSESDQSSILLRQINPLPVSSQSAVITFTTTTVSTSFATGSLSSVAPAAAPPPPAVVTAEASTPSPAATPASASAATRLIGAGSSATSDLPPPQAATSTTAAPADDHERIIGAPVNLSYDDLAQALCHCLAREDVSDRLTDKFTMIVVNLVRQYDERHKSDQEAVKKLHQIIDDLKTEINDLEQYSRRNSVRISCNNWREFPFEDCEKLVLDLAWDLGFQCQPWMIDRVHRNGKHVPGRERDILVKFISHKFKSALLKARSDTGSHPDFRNVYINEDLSAETGKLYFKARNLKKDNKLYSAGTRDGKILVSRFRGEAPVLVRNETELNNLAARGTYSNAVRREAPTENINDRLLREAGLPPQRTQPRVNNRQQQRPSVQPPRPARNYRVTQIPPFRQRPEHQRNQPPSPVGPGNAPPGASGTGRSTSNEPHPVDASTPLNQQRSGRRRSNSASIHRPADFSFETY